MAKKSLETLLKDLDQHIIVIEAVLGGVADEDRECWTVTLQNGYQVEIATSLAAAEHLDSRKEYEVLHSGRVLVIHLHKYIGWKVEHDNGQWHRLERVEPSPDQGWSVILEGGIKLQSCYNTGSYQVREPYPPSHIEIHGENVIAVTPPGDDDDLATYTFLKGNWE